MSDPLASAVLISLSRTIGSSQDSPTVARYPRVKFPILNSTIVALLCLKSIALGDTEIAREFALVKAQHTREVAQAVEPIDRRYQLSLEQLLRRATQAANLDLALSIQNELKTMQAGEKLRAVLDGSTWAWTRPGVRETVQFFKDGTFKHQLFPGTWEVVDAHTIRMKASSIAEWQLRFNDNYTTFEAIGGLPGDQGVKGARTSQ
jgi:hypothetical protein